MGKQEHLKLMNSIDIVEDEQFNDVLVIVLDTATFKRKSEDRFKNRKYLFKIDLHPEIDTYGDSGVDTTYSSTSEMIYELVQESMVLQ